MKKKLAIPAALVLGSGIAIAGTSFIDGIDTVPPVQDFVYLDLDEDGQLSRDEARAVQGLDFKQADSNGDGALSEEEYWSVVHI